MSAAAPSPADDDDDDIVEYCYRHPSRDTALHCSTCERAICTDCAIPAAVGIKCPECARQPRAALAVVPPAKLARATGGGIVAGFVGGVAYSVFHSQVGFLSLIVAWILGIAIGEVTRWCAGGFRDHLVARVAATCAFLGLSAPLIVDLVIRGPAAFGQSAIFLLLGAGIAAYSAAQRTL